MWILNEVPSEDTRVRSVWSPASYMWVRVEKKRCMYCFVADKQWVTFLVLCTSAILTILFWFRSKLKTSFKEMFLLIAICLLATYHTIFKGCFPSLIFLCLKKNNQFSGNGFTHWTKQTLINKIWARCSFFSVSSCGRFKFYIYTNNIDNIVSKVEY